MKRNNMRDKLRASSTRLAWAKAGLPPTAKRSNLTDAQRRKLTAAEASVERGIIQTVATLTKPKRR